MNSPVTTSASELQRAWARVRSSLRESAGARLFDQWLKPMELIDGDEPDAVRLALPSAFMTNWVRSHYQDRLLLEFRQALPEVRSIAIETRAPGPVLTVVTADTPATQAAAAVAPAASEPDATDLLTEAPAAPAAAQAGTPAPAPSLASPAGERPALDPRNTFDRFVVDASNRVALNAAKLLAEDGPPRFSPLFLHAGTGQGKTHLMHAIAHAFLAVRPEARVLYMSAERFMFEFVASMRARDTFAFKARLRSADLLLIDDLQFIAGKDSTQEEFFHTINEIMGANKRLVIAADRAPQALDGVEARILSRLGGGLVADIKAPGLDLRRAILSAKLDDLPDTKVPAEVLDLIAGRIHTNIRELEGALNRVVAYAQLTGERIDLEFATQTLGDAFRGAQRRVTIDEIQKLVTQHFALKPLDLVSARRSRCVARPRQIAMYLSKRLTTRSLPEIGRKFGGRDHSTVIHAVRKIEELRDTDREIDSAVRVLLRELES
ncbi:chromosomal replication initiator protein DnaA [Sphingomonas aerophila]|uniref:Chromosomal replication initiator protein DnaA n=1 Tax=Sphingomonas aerophila TaxID=1344948 RepID=A0A7W9BE30_9SPHN|nr:chromosomal replication initiator protein DnaA [Sphingomonas aerophila]MBB5715530.1 chromosomal replication initiator protein [Sphingomonas aerophila]